MGQRNPHRPYDLRIGVNVRNFCLHRCFACIFNVYPKLPVELRISAVITYDFLISPLRFICKCVILKPTAERRL